MKFLSSTVLFATLLVPVHGFFPGFPSLNGATKTAGPALIQDVSFVAPDTSDVLEEACRDTAARMKRIKVPVSATISPQDEQVGISYVHWPATSKTNNNLPPVILLHGFDSSCLEYRRLGSKLAAQGIDTYAVDILGWGYTQLAGIADFSAAAKVEALTSFVTTVLGESAPFCVAGASLGGAAAIELASSASTSSVNCQGLILIDAQGFVDGVGPMAALPKPLAKAGVAVLKSIPLRSSANQMSYFDKETYATDDAVTIGRLHCVQQGDLWSDAMVSFMKSGGFTPSAKVPTIQAPALVLWGRQDGILDGKEFANKFVETLPNAELQWIEECGHVPHLEQPDVTAETIYTFVATKVATSNNKQQGEKKGADAFSKLFQLN